MSACLGQPFTDSFLGYNTIKFDTNNQRGHNVNFREDTILKKILKI
jgi:hypothetical protein